jgi:hypothetical protein
MAENVFQGLMNAFLNGFYNNVHDLITVKPMNHTLSKSMEVDDVMTSVECKPNTFILSEPDSHDKLPEKSDYFLASLEYKAPFGKLRHSGAYSAKDQLVIESAVLSEYRTEDSLIKSALLDGFAIANLFAFADSEKDPAIFLITNRVTEAKSFLLHLLWLITKGEERLFFVSEDKGGIAVKSDDRSSTIAPVEFSGHLGRYSSTPHAAPRGGDNAQENIKANPADKKERKKKENTMKQEREFLVLSDENINPNEKFLMLSDENSNPNEKFLVLSDENINPNKKSLMLSESNIRKHNILTMPNKLMYI